MERGPSEGAPPEAPSVSYHIISFDKYLETLKQAFTVYILMVFNAVRVDKS